MNFIAKVLTNQRMWTWIAEEALKSAVLSVTSVAVASATKSLTKRLEKKKERPIAGFMRYR